MKVRLAVFLIVCLAQLAWAASAIWSGETRLETGRMWRFRVAPVDPADLARGRYVQLAFQATSGPALDPEPYVTGTVAYALLAEDAEGFAAVTGVIHRRPASDAYLIVRVRSASSGENARIRFTFPVDRLYLPETRAPVAEELYRSARGDAWAEIRVSAGQATLLDVYLDGVPISAAAERELGRRDAK